MVLTRTRFCLGGWAVNERNKLIRRFTANRFTTVGYDATYFYSFCSEQFLLSSPSFVRPASRRSLWFHLCERGETSYRNCASLNYESWRLRDLFLKGGHPAIPSLLPRSGNETLSIRGWWHRVLYFSRVSRFSELFAWYFYFSFSSFRSTTTYCLTANFLCGSSSRRRYGDDKGVKSLRAFEDYVIRLPIGPWQ